MTFDFNELQRRAGLTYFEARFDQQCTWCPIWIFQGDTMAVTEEGDYICDDCAHDEEINGGYKK